MVRLQRGRRRLSMVYPFRRVRARQRLRRPWPGRAVSSSAGPTGAALAASGRAVGAQLCSAALGRLFGCGGRSDAGREICDRGVRDPSHKAGPFGRIVAVSGFIQRPFYCPCDLLIAARVPIVVFRDRTRGHDPCALVRRFAIRMGALPALSPRGFLDQSHGEHLLDHELVLLVRQGLGCPASWHLC